MLAASEQVLCFYKLLYTALRKSTYKIGYRNSTFHRVPFTTPVSEMKRRGSELLLHIVFKGTRSFSKYTKAIPLKLPP